MYLTIQAIVLRVTDYNDRDALLTVLSKAHGKLTIKARGLRRKNSPLTAPCQLLAYGEFTLFEYKGQYTINEAHGHANIPVINMFVGGAVKLSVAWLLTGNPDIAIRGVPVASVTCFLTIATLNLFSMNRCIAEPPHMLRNMLRPLLSGVIMAACVFAAYFGLGRVFTLDSTIGKLALVGAPILVGVVVYVICVIKLKAITREDCLLLPKGEKIAKLLHL